MNVFYSISVSTSSSTLIERQTAVTTTEIVSQSVDLNKKILRTYNLPIIVYNRR